MFKKFEMELAGRTLRVDVGRVAAQANGLPGAFWVLHGASYSCA